MLPCKLRAERHCLYFFGNVHSLDTTTEVFLKESYFKSSKIVFRNMNNVWNGLTTVKYGKQTQFFPISVFKQVRYFNFSPTLEYFQDRFRICLVILTCQLKNDLMLPVSIYLKILPHIQFKVAFSSAFSSPSDLSFASPVVEPNTPRNTPSSNL